jgi:hypothetical protein
MSIADEEVRAAPVPKPSPPDSIVMNLITMAILLVLVILSALLLVVYGAAGWTIHGWVGLIGGIAIGIVLIPAAFMGVWVGSLLLIKLLIFIFSIGPEDVEIGECAVQPEGSESASRLLSAPRPRPLFRPVGIISATAVVWVIYGLPALRNATNSHELWQAIQVAVILPLGFIGLVGRHWLTALVRKTGRS